MQKNKVAVVFFVYKRATNFKKILKVVRQYAPQDVFIISDGPKIGEENICQEARMTLENEIDWKCTIYKNYATDNIGLQKRFKSGIDWVFTKVDKAIFIEDDCIPHFSFFQFCEELLEKFKHNQKIFTISGNNFQKNQNIDPNSYYFSKFPHIWGWATWKRAWKHYSQDLSQLNDPITVRSLKDNINYPILYYFLRMILDLIKYNKINTWDYQLTYSSLINGYLNIIPMHNLVTNCGVDGLATHTKIKSPFSDLSVSPMNFPLTHPKQVISHKIFDKYTMKHVYVTPVGFISTFFRYLLSKIIG